MAAGESIDRDENTGLLRDKHVKWCLRALHVLPQTCDFLDSNRLLIAYFAVSGLDLLNALSAIENEKSGIIEWIYYLQVTADEKGSSSTRCGFRGSTPCTIQDADIESRENFDEPSLASTFSALSTLLVLGDDLKRVDKKSIIKSLKELQGPDGSFRPVYSESENDMRFIYCAACISYVLQDWSGMDVEKCVQYIQQSYTYEGGIALGPGFEAHGGSTFCAVAALCLMGKLESAFTYDQLKKLQRWCLLRQYDGFQGRPNKPTDTCYSFWVGAALKLLDCYHLVNHEKLRKFVHSTQDDMVGGMGKWRYEPPDMLHTYLGLSGLSLMEKDNLLPVHPALNISQRAVSFLHSLHSQWSSEGS